MHTSSLVTQGRGKAERKYYARTCYMTKVENELVGKAAKLEGKSVSEFISEAALERSIEVIRLENRLTLTGEPPAPEPVSQNCDRDLSVMISCPNSFPALTSAGDDGTSS